MDWEKFKKKSKRKKYLTTEKSFNLGWKKKRKITEKEIFPFFFLL